MIVQLPGIQPEIAVQAIPDDERVWVPQAPEVWFRPLLLNTVTGSWCNLLRVRKSGVLSRHIHPSWVTGYEDVFTKIAMCRAHYEAVGLGTAYVEQFIR